MLLFCKKRRMKLCQSDFQYQHLWERTDCIIECMIRKAEKSLNVTSVNFKQYGNCWECDGMCYKDKVQRDNAEKLQRKFNEDNVPEFIRDYLEDIESKSGALNYWSVIRDFLMWLIGDGKIINKKSISNMEIVDFNVVYPQHVSRYLRQKEEKGLSPTTLETRKNIIRSFLSNVGYYKESTIGDIKEFFKRVKYKGISSSNNLIKKLPSEKQLQDMEEKIMRKNDEFVRIRNLSILRVLKGTGLRESELAGLDIGDLYLGEEMPYIKVLRKGSYREIEKEPVYLTGDATNAIKEWLEYRNRLENILDEEAVFVNKNGNRLTEYNIQSIFKTYGNGQLTPHMIRHWYATVMANTGNLAFAQQQLGHSSMTTTVNNYANGAYGMKDVLANM